MQRAIENFINSRKFSYTILTLILLNGFVLGLQTSEYLMKAIPGLLKFLELSIVVIFVFEVGLRLYLNPKRFLNNGWDVFDLIVIICCIPPHFRSLSILRIFHLLRTIPNMHNILLSIRRVAASIFVVLFIMLILFYTFGVIGVRLYGESAPTRFSEIYWSFLSLAQIMVGDEYGNIIRDVVRENLSGWLFFIVTTVAFTFVIINLFIGVVVDAIQSAVSKKEKRIEKETRMTLLNIQDRLDQIEAALKGKKDGKDGKKKP